MMRRRNENIAIKVLAASAGGLSCSACSVGWWRGVITLLAGRGSGPAVGARGCVRGGLAGRRVLARRRRVQHETRRVRERPPCNANVYLLCAGPTMEPNQAPSQYGSPMAQPGLGIPLGGVGTGAFMINQAGTFGPWDMGRSINTNYENRILPQAAFHVRVQSGNATRQRARWRSTTLSLGRLPAWNRLPPERAPSCSTNRTPTTAVTRPPTVARACRGTSPPGISSRRPRSRSGSPRRMAASEELCPRDARVESRKRWLRGSGVPERD